MYVGKFKLDRPTKAGAGQLCQIPWHTATKLSLRINEHNCRGYKTYSTINLGRKNDPFKMSWMELNLIYLRVRHSLLKSTLYQRLRYGLAPVAYAMVNFAINHLVPFFLLA